ncbi:secretion-regulating guanine nucleotide exchange factor isoform X2 [Oryzias melastigma]|uniref:secretion-regulating guanine nucleotide exchange factor isoform X2 n=1 Tax=Oryzias melastigma TaxID=30732 RepID=UPI00168D28C9|nr:secretion-regulating guanine nucleotide exchange factor isoform X2 [Oryzias melastigma]
MEHSLLDFCLQTWGANSYGQLGQGHAEDQPVPWLSGGSELQTEAVRVVRGGGGHSVVITEGGEVFVCGQNHKGQLGIGHCANVSTFQICPIFNQRVTDVACGWDFSLLLTDSGKLLACGSNAFGQLGVGETVTHTADPRLVESLKEPIVSVAAGLRHSLAVNDSGCVYQWGNGLFSHAKRALGPHSVPSHLRSSIPCLVPGLSQKKSVVVKAGSAHCVCLTEEGELFLWGSNKHGQLGTSESFLPSPSPLRRSLLNGEKVSNVWSGWSHIIAQTESGRVFTWGRGDYGQLGRPNSDSQSPEQLLTDSVAGNGQSRAVCLPAEVHALRGATQISCGSEHNLAVVDFKRIVIVLHALSASGVDQHATGGTGMAWSRTLVNRQGVFSQKRHEASSICVVLHRHPDSTHQQDTSCTVMVKRNTSGWRSDPGNGPVVTP